VGRDILDEPGLRRTELEQLLPVLVLGELLLEPLTLRIRLDALGLQLLQVLGLNLSEPLFRLLDGRLGAPDRVLLGP